MNPTDAQIKSLGASLGMEIGNFSSYSDGFAFTVKTELEAYKAAYKYQFLRTVVAFVPHLNLWRVNVYYKKNANEL